MNFENQKALENMINGIINSENRFLLDELKELRTFKENNRDLKSKYEKLELKLSRKESFLEMLKENIKVFMNNTGAELVDESWQDGNSETGESWGEEIVFYRYNGFELPLTHPIQTQIK